jgi:hypothetical protein
LVLDVLSNYENPEIRGRIPIEHALMRQVERCNISLTGYDPSVFEKNVMALVTMLPDLYRAEVLEYLENECIEAVDKWEYKRWCGVPLGSPSQPYRDAEGKVISPVRVREEYVDYEKLYGKTMTTIEEIGLSWNVESVTVEAGKLRDEFHIEGKYLKKARTFLEELLKEAEEDGHLYTLWDLTNKLVPATPPTRPTYEIETDYMTEVDEYLEDRLGEEGEEILGVSDDDEEPTPVSDDDEDDWSRPYKDDDFEDLFGDPT